MRKKVFSISLVTVTVLALFLLSSCFSPAKPVKLGTSIHDAISNWTADTAATVTGVVIGYPGREVNGNDVGGFSRKIYIEDEKSGVIVYNSDLNESYTATPSSYKFNIGDVVTVSGTLTKYHDNFEITPKSTKNIVKTGDTFDVQPVDLTSASTFNGYDLMLVKVSGTATNVSNKSFTLETTNLGDVKVYDSTYGKHLDFDTHIANGNNVEVVGIVSISYGNYEILPRTADDITKK